MQQGLSPYNIVWPHMTLLNTTAGIFVLLLLYGTNAMAASAPYRGQGGQLEAAGIVAGAYILVTANIEHCAKNARMKARSMRSAREYLNKNQQAYMDMMRKLPELANLNGGNAEVQRLKRELETALSDMETEARARVRAPVPSDAECTRFLDSVDSGMLDLTVKYNNELTRIMR